MSGPGNAKAPNRSVTAVSWALNILGVVIAVWEFFEFDPFPIALIGCVAAPLAALGLAAALPDRFGLLGDKRRGVSSLAVLFIAPLVSLIFKAAFTVQLLHLSSDLVPAVVGALVGGLGARLWWVRFRGNWRIWPLLSLLGLLVACAVFEELDARLDHAAPLSFRVPVEGKSVSRRRTVSYNVALPAWGPQHEPGSVRVSPEVFANVQPGQDVCILLHAGFLGAPWYTVGVCQDPKRAGA